MRYSNIIITRKIIATFVLILFIILFAFAGSVPGLEYVASLQVGAALLAGSAVILLLLALVTLLFGRVYCSLLCPLGITQDALAYFRKRDSYKPLPNKALLRFGVLTLFFASFASGYMLVFESIDPYSAFGRIGAAILAPVGVALHNTLAWCASLFGSNIVSGKEIYFHGWPVFIMALLTLVILLCLVLKWGRAWCNYCPIGTTLGFLGKKALFRVHILEDKCVSCGRCQKSCKTGCIDIKQGELDNTRCVACLVCAGVCPKDAMAYSPIKKGATIGNSSRRAFLKGMAPGLVIATTLPKFAEAAEVEKINRPDIIPERRSMRPRQEPIVPPGAKSLAHFARHCIGCQLCVTSCPNDVLVSSMAAPGLLQPSMSFELGYCRPNCVKCGEVCPAGAIVKIDKTEKKLIRIGQASINSKLCIIYTDQVQCTACQRICPQEAISLHAEAGLPDNLKMPKVDAAKCTGCGACEYVCPAKPLAAIAVDAFKVHELAGKDCATS